MLVRQHVAGTVAASVTSRMGYFNWVSFVILILLVFWGGGGCVASLRLSFSRSLFSLLFFAPLFPRRRWLQCIRSLP